MYTTFKYVSLPSLIPVKLSWVSFVQKKTSNYQSSLDLIQRSVTPTILPRRTCFSCFCWLSFSLFSIFFPSVIFPEGATVYTRLPWWPCCSGQLWLRLLYIIVQTLQQSFSLVKNDPILCLSATPSLHLLYITHQLNIFFIQIFIINGIIRFGVYFNEQINHWIKYEIGTECMMSFMSL